MSSQEIIKVEILISRKELELLARPGKTVASRDEVRELVAQLFREHLAARKKEESRLRSKPFPKFLVADETSLTEEVRDEQSEVRS